MGPWGTVADVMRDLNEDARPTAPEIPEAQRRNPHNGRHLRAIHRHHLHDIEQARALLGRMEAGEASGGDVQAAIAGMDLTQNFRLFGNICGRSCMILSGHHNIEEQHMFPSLEALGAEGVLPVVSKLRAEHKIVHALIAALHEAAVRLMNAPTEAEFAKTRAIFDQLEAVVRSHFSYEETELDGALALLDAL